MFESLKQKIRCCAWQEKVLCVSLLFFIIFYAVFFSDFNQFPSEYYGGDHYAHFASALKIYNTLNPFISSHYYSELQHYPWFVPGIIAFIAKISFQNPFSVAIFFPILILLAAIIITYWCGNLFFRNKSAALLLSLSWVVMFVPNFHPSEFAKQLMIPLIAVMILLTYRQEKISHLISAGIIYGIAGLEHMVTFVIASISIFFLFFIKLFETKNIKKQCASFLIVCSIGLVLASLFWLPILIKYHAHTLNDWQLYSAASLYPSAELVAGFFIPALTGYELLFLVSACIVFYFCFKNRDTYLFVPCMLFSATLIGIIHPYFTYPLFNLSLGYYRFPIVLDFMKHLIIVWAVWMCWSELSLFVEKKYAEKKKLFYAGFGVISFVIISLVFVQTISNYQNSERYEYAVEDNELIDAYYELNTYIKENNLISEEGVTITTHADFGFFFNAMTGKNVMVDRITHASSFVDPNKRAADMAVVLYGNNRTKAKELIEEYHLAYGFMEKGSVEFKSTCLARWNETIQSRKKDKTLSAYWCIQTSPEYKEYLKENGIETATAYVRLAAGDKDVPLKKVLVIKPRDIVLETKTIYQYADSEGSLLLELYKITE
jgi:hypothetical protein